MVFTTSPLPSPPSEEELQKIEEFATINEEVDNFFMHLIIDVDFSDEAFEGIEVIENSPPFQKKAKMSHKIRRRLRHFGDSSGAAKIILLANRVTKYRPCAKIAPIPRENADTWLPNHIKNGLYATRHIRAGEFVLSSIEAFISTPEDIGRNMHGLLFPKIILFDGLQQDFSYYEVVEAPSCLKRKRNSSGFLRRKMLSGFYQQQQEIDNGRPHVNGQYESDDNSSDLTEFGKYVMCIDLSVASEEARSIRRNCTPNCTIRYVVLNQRMYIFITTTCDIEQGTELTLPHDFDYYYSNKLVQCSHPLDNVNLCQFEKSRRMYYTKHVRLLDEQKRMEKESRMRENAEIRGYRDASK